MGRVPEGVLPGMALAGAVLATLLTGCASIGPPTLERDRIDYVSGISDSWKRQMLLNLLKVRYTDTPVFMDVSSVIASYSLETEVRLTGQYASPGRGDTYGNLGATGRYGDRPTITYQPLSGDKFARSLMAPIPVTGILSLIQAGYPADFVLRVCVNSINGLDNDYGGPGNPRAGNPKFRELLAAMRESQLASGAGFRTKSKDKQSVVMVFPPQGEETKPAVRRIRELLHLDPAATEANVVYGSLPEPDAEIAVVTRSIMQVMIDVASHLEVPAIEVAEDRVYAPNRTPEQESLFPALLAVRTGPAPPEDAFTAARYRGRWHWIDDRDPQSKRTLAFLLMLFSLTEGGSTQGAPVVTIPAR